MQLISCHNGKLLTLNAGEFPAGTEGRFSSGLSELDALAPGKTFARAAVHEMLSEAGEGMPLFFAMLLARACTLKDEKFIVWCDPAGEIYPPALAAQRVPLHRLLLLKARTGDEMVWAIAECLRCKAVGAVVAAPPRLSRIQARRLQLAAERGGGAGFLLRPCRGPGVACHAAATRWLVRPAPGSEPCNDGAFN